MQPSVGVNKCVEMCVFVVFFAGWMWEEIEGGENLNLGGVEVGGGGGDWGGIRV